MKSIYPFYVMMSLSPLMAAITAIFPEIQETSLRLTGLKSSITQTQEHDFENHFERLQAMENVSDNIKEDIGKFRKRVHHVQEDRGHHRKRTTAS